MSDERPRKSWKDIDRARDGGRQRRDDGPSHQKNPRSQKSYRAALDRAFASGKIGELVQQTDEGAQTVQDATRIKLMRAIANAEDPASITQTTDAYLAQYQLPADPDVLAKVVQHKNPTRQLEAMELLQQVLGEHQPKRIRALIGALKLIRDTSGDREMEELAVKLLDQLD